MAAGRAEMSLEPDAPAGDGAAPELTAAEVRSELLHLMAGVTVAWSVAGREVGFMTGFDSGLEVGSFAVVTTQAGIRLLVQVQDLRFSERSAMQVDLATDDLVGGSSMVRSAQVGLALRSVNGAGQILAEIVDGSVRPFSPVGFSEASIEHAPDDLVAQLGVHWWRC